MPLLMSQQRSDTCRTGICSVEAHHAVKTRVQVRGWNLGHWSANLSPFKYCGFIRARHEKWNIVIHIWVIDRTERERERKQSVMAVATHMHNILDTTDFMIMCDVKNIPYFDWVLQCVLSTWEWQLKRKLLSSQQAGVVCGWVAVRGDWLFPAERWLQCLSNELSEGFCLPFIPFLSPFSP